MVTVVKVLVQQLYYVTVLIQQVEQRDSDGGYVQGTYVIPTGTKLGVSYGVSNLDDNTADTANAVNLVKSNTMLTVGAYHPLTKHLNLVAEYSNVEVRKSSIYTR